MGVEWGVIFIKLKCVDLVELLEVYILKDLLVDREDWKMLLFSFK